MNETWPPTAEERKSIESALSNCRAREHALRLAELAVERARLALREEQLLVTAAVGAALERLGEPAAEYDLRQHAFVLRKEAAS